jgi:peptidyl-dipeptidase Dcp
MMLRHTFLSLSVCAALTACSDSTSDQVTTQLEGEELAVSTVESTQSSENPLYEESPLFLHYPQFDQIENHHYLPAFERGMAEQAAEIDAIASFDNSILAMELSGQLLGRVSNVFFSLSGAHTNDDIRELEQQLAPQLAAHSDSILLNRKLFARIRSLYDNRDSLQLNAESRRLLEQYYVDFVREGAALELEQQQRLKEINAQLAVLETQFSQNVLSEVNALAIVIDSREELTGLDDATIAAAEQAAIARDLAGRYVIPLLNTSGQPALASLQNRALRERIHTTSLSRGSRGG